MFRAWPARPVFVRDGLRYTVERRVGKFGRKRRPARVQRSSGSELLLYECWRGGNLLWFRCSRGVDLL